PRAGDGRRRAATTNGAAALAIPAYGRPVRETAETPPDGSDSRRVQDDRPGRSSAWVPHQNDRHVVCTGVGAGRGSVAGGESLVGGGGAGGDAGGVTITVGVGAGGAHRRPRACQCGVASLGSLQRMRKWSA